MKHTNTAQIKRAYCEYLKSPNWRLWHCYERYSESKEAAYEYCLDLVHRYNGGTYRIIGFNSMTFSFGFVGEINGKEAFFYITKSYDRFIYLDEIGLIGAY